MNRTRPSAMLKEPRSRRSSKGTEWRTLTKSSARFFPRKVRPWMLLSSSMTKKLAERTGKAVLVDLLKNERGRLYPDEMTLFQSRDRSGFVREVCLYNGEKKLLTARTVFLSDRLKENSSLSSLGSRPLGELLFAKGNTGRWTLREYAVLRPNSPLFPLIRQCRARHVRVCWARRTMFLLEGEPLLVTEIFLPSMLTPVPRAHSAPPRVKRSETPRYVAEEAACALV